MNQIWSIKKQTYLDDIFYPKKHGTQRMGRYIVLMNASVMQYTSSLDGILLLTK